MIITEVECAWLMVDSYRTPDEDDMRDGYVHMQPVDCEILDECQQVRYHAEDDSEAYTGKLGSVAFVAPRGTASLADADKDRKFKKVPFHIKPDISANRTFEFKGQGKVHRGCLEYLSNIAGDIVTAIDELEVKRVLVVGHSLAGGVAPMLAYILSKAGYDVWLVTGNGMRFANKEAATAIEHQLEPPRAADEIPSKFRITRLVHSFDIVPHLPPFFFGYRHLRGLRYLTSGGKWRRSIPWHYVIGGFLIGTVKSLVSSFGREQAEKHRMGPFAKEIARQADKRKSRGQRTFVTIDASE